MSAPLGLGSQYASAAYRARLAQAGLVASMSRAGNCYDNAAMESFWGKLKTELIHRRKFASPAEARTAIFEHAEVFYNQRRLAPQRPRLPVSCGL